jgi:hypothetical protein
MAETFSLQDALDMQDNPASTADEPALAEAELLDDTQNEEGETKNAAIDVDVDDDSETTNADDLPVFLGTTRVRKSRSKLSSAAAFAASAMKPVVSNYTPTPALVHRSPNRSIEAAAPASPPTATATTAVAKTKTPREHNKNSSNISDNRKATKRVPVLYGTLYSEKTWEEETQRMAHKTILKGSWRYNDETSEEANPQHNFELVSRGSKKDSNSEEPQSGIYSGEFGLSYAHVTPKGKRSSKFSKIAEPMVKLEFRKLGNFYRIQGRGSNALGGDFILNGTAKPTTERDSNHKYVIELRKTYLLDMRHNEGSSSTPSSLLRSQQRSLFSKPKTPTNPGELFRATATSPRPVPASVQSKTNVKHSSSLRAAEHPEARRQTKGGDSDERIESEASYNNNNDSSDGGSTGRNGRVRASQKQRERQDIPTSRRARENNKTSTPLPPTPKKLADEASLALTPTNTGVDRVNGRGMWHAWTRSFDTPLLALLDLFDNAVDASWSLLPEEGEPRQPKPKINVDIDRMGRNGVVIRNASKFIPPLRDVLQVYKSSKAGEGDNSIGENGIGVKHACASLSSLSFVFTKTTDPSDKSCTIGMGILMQELQRDDGIVLPSVSFSLHDASGNGSLCEVQEMLEEHCANFPETWGIAIREYGDDHFGDGIDRCLDHMDVLRTHPNWKDSDNVFALVLANLKHAAFDNDEKNSGEEEIEIIEVGDIASSSSPMARRGKKSSTEIGGRKTTHQVKRGGDSDVDEDAQRSMSLLKTLHEKLPYLYLHLHDLDVRVENKAMESIYWERRLAELSRFELQLSQTELWSKIQKSRWQNNKGKNVYDVTNQKEAVRFFCGFDPYRCRGRIQHLVNDGKGKKGGVEAVEDDTVMSYVPGGSTIGGEITQMGNNSAIKIYLYSRQSGRLIKVQNDPRNELGLTSGSSDFCQGLTVIIDDYNGTLPLNPTKQDTAYGHSKHGQIHAANLKEWTAAITHFYWNYHHDRCGNSKVAVTQAVSKTKASLEDAYRNFRRNPKLEKKASIIPLCKGTFISYTRIDFALTTYTNKSKIRANKVARESVVAVVKRHQVSRLDIDEAVLGGLSKQGSARKRRGRDKDSEAQYESSLEAASTPSKRSRKAHRNEMELQDRIVLEDMMDGGSDVGKNNSQQPQQDGNALVIENQHLEQQMQQVHSHNIRLQQNCRDGTNHVRMLQNQCQELGQDRSMFLKKITALEDQKKRLVDYGREQHTAAVMWKAKVEQLQKKLLSQKPSSSQNDIGDLISDNLENSAVAEMGKLKREVKIYKSRAEFYMKETEAKKKQIDTLVQEKSLFEDRVRELEEAQLSVSTHGGDLLQF